jgi:hypothetical protein
MRHIGKARHMRLTVLIIMIAIALPVGCGGLYWTMLGPEQRTGGWGPLEYTECDQIAIKPNYYKRGPAVRLILWPAHQVDRKFRHAKWHRPFIWLY